VTLSVIFYPYHFVCAILSIPFCPMPFCPYTILSIPFCPYHFVRYHFVLEPHQSNVHGYHLTCPLLPLLRKVRGAEEDQFLLFHGRRGPVPVTPWQKRTSSCYFLAEED